MKRPLRIGADFTLPEEAITQTFAVIAKRGVGKTYTALVLVEEMVGAGLPVVVIDPIGVAWGLRSSSDGKSAGLPVTIFGGDHADVPLEVTAGGVIADFIIEERQPTVLDMSLLRKGEQVRFMTDFAERLYHKNRNPLHVVLDEADAFAPQRPQHGQERMLGAIEDLVRRGRARGLGLTLVTQRAAVLNKDVLTQCEVLVALRTIAPQDRDAIDAWIKVHGTPEQRAKMMASLPSLPIGTAWFWSPGWLDVFQQVEVRKRHTFDSSATPKAGAKPAKPRVLADVDLEALRERMALTIERAKADDPRELKKRVAELERELAKKPAAAPEIVQVSVLTKQDEVSLDRTIAALGRTEKTIDRTIARIDAIDKTLKDMGALLHRLPLHVEAIRRGPPKTVPRRNAAPVPDYSGVRNTDEAAVEYKRLGVVDRPHEVASGNSLGRCERKILTALCQYDGRTKTQLSVLTGYAPRGGGFLNAISRLKTGGLIDGLLRVAGRDDMYYVTAKGRETLGPFTPLPRGHALLEHWMSQLGQCERKCLEALVHQWPEALSKEQIANGAGYESKGGGFLNALSRLRTLELVSGGVRGEPMLRASEALFA